MSEKENINQEENVKEVLSEDEMENVNGGGYFDGLLTYSGPPPVAPTKPITPAPTPKPVASPPPSNTYNMYGQTVKKNGKP